jgi:hypothetical protein
VNVDLSHNLVAGTMCPGGGSQTACAIKTGHLQQLETLDMSNNVNLTGTLGEEYFFEAYSPNLKSISFENCNLVGALPDAQTRMQTSAIAVNLKGNPQMKWAGSTFPSWVTVGGLKQVPNAKYSCPELFHKGAKVEVDFSYYDNSLCVCGRGYYDNGEENGIQCTSFPFNQHEANKTTGTVSDKYGSQAAQHERLQDGLRTTYLVHAVVDEATATPAKAMEVELTDKGLSDGERLSVFEGATMVGQTPIWSRDRMTAGNTMAKFFVLSDDAVVSFSTTSSDNAESFSLKYTALDSCPTDASVATNNGRCLRPVSKVRQSVSLMNVLSADFNDTVSNNASIVAAIANATNTPKRAIRLLSRLDSTHERRLASTSELSIRFELWAATAGEVSTFRVAAELASGGAFSAALQREMQLQSTPSATFASVTIDGTCPPGTEFYSGADPVKYCSDNADFARASFGGESSCCTPCAAGTQQMSLSNTDKCLPCPAGSYKQSSGAGQCRSCGPNMVSEESRVSCRCVAGFFYTMSAPNAAKWDERGMACNECHKGMVCDTPGLGFDEVNSRPGFWQVKTWYAKEKRVSLKMLTCPIVKEQICLGGSDTMVGASCREGHNGPMCTTCAQGYQLGADGLCDSCSSSSNLTEKEVVAILALLVIFGIIVIFGLNYRREISIRLRKHTDSCCRAHGCKKQRAGGQQSSRLRVLAPGEGEHVSDTEDQPNAKKQIGGSLGLMMKAKILLGLLQVSSQFTFNFDIDWPTDFASLQRWFSFVNIELPSMGCVVKFNFVDKYLSAILTPMICAAPFAVGFFVCAAKLSAKTTYDAKGNVQKGGRYNSEGEIDWWEHKQNMCMKAVVYMLFLVYPSTCSMILRMFHCETLENGKSYLTADMSIECSGSAPISTQLFGSTMDYTDYRSGAVVMLLVYALGTPLFFFAVLWVNRHRLYVGDKGHEPDEEVEAELGFLYAGYEREYWWWECVELLRKLALTSLITFINPGTSSQLFIAVIMAQIFITLYARQQPYESDADDALQLCSQLHIWFTALAGLVVKMSSVVENSGERHTNEDAYQSALFDAALVASTLAPLILAAAQCFIRARKNIAHDLVLLEHAAMNGLKSAKNMSHKLSTHGDEKERVIADQLPSTKIQV